jgi:hypothetical protein
MSMIPEAAHVLAILAGVVFGSAAISTACWVWVRRQIFAYGGTTLCSAGVALLGLSIWHSVEFGASGTRMTMKLQAALEQQSMRITELAERVDNDPDEDVHLAATVLENLRPLVDKGQIHRAQDVAGLAARALTSNIAIATAVADTARIVAALSSAKNTAGVPFEDERRALDSAIKQTDAAVANARPLIGECQKLLGSDSCPK